MRAKELELSILTGLSDEDACDAVELHRWLSTEGRESLMPGALMQAVRDLLENGMISSAAVGNHLFVYRLTPAGRRFLGGVRPLEPDESLR